MHPAIGKINWINFREGIDDFETALANLLNAIGKHANYVRQHSQFWDKALEWDRYQQRAQYLLIGEDRVQAESLLRVRFKDEQPPCEPTNLRCEFITESTKNAYNLMTQEFLCHATKERGIEVFICYSRTDSDFARQLNDALQSQGKTTWFYLESIAPGSNFQQEIYRGIESVDNFLFVISHSSIKFRSLWAMAGARG